jgi:hypothetical protein
MACFRNVSVNTLHEEDDDPLTKCLHTSCLLQLSFSVSGGSLFLVNTNVQGGSNMTGTNCGLFTHKSSLSYLNHLVLNLRVLLYGCCC